MKILSFNGFCLYAAYSLTCLVSRLQIFLKVMNETGRQRLVDLRSPLHAAIWRDASGLYRAIA